MSSVENLIKNIIAHDKKTFLEDLRIRPVFKEPTGDLKILADFTEYNPLHKGHLHCMLESKKMVPEGIFVAIVPGPFERSGRGIPYIMTRQARAKIAVAVGADVVVEGPPMGVMGSGQYSLCLARMFQALNADYIPRGYKENPEFEILLERISNGVGVAPKPYRMVDMESGQVLLKGKLNEDNYVIVSFSKSMTKIGFNFKDKFIFIPRIEGVSGTLIRESVISGDLEPVNGMLPPETIEILKNEMENGRAPLNQVRDIDGIIQTANNASVPYLKSLSLIDERTIDTIIEKRPFKTIEEVESCIARGFSRHHRQRVLSSLEVRVDRDDISRYIDNYPSTIRILNYKNKEVLREFKKRISHRRLEICQ